MLAIAVGDVELHARECDAVLCLVGIGLIDIPAKRDLVAVSHGAARTVHRTRELDRDNRTTSAIDLADEVARAIDAERDRLAALGQLAIERRRIDELDRVGGVCRAGGAESPGKPSAFRD